jgi:hypothetical protein
MGNALQFMLLLRQLFMTYIAGDTIVQERVKPVLDEGNRRLDAMVAEDRGPNDEDYEWVQNTRHKFVADIEAAAANAPPGS